ncbi:hypothetical protein BsWGS_23806 [Bradybaena similaris]
MHLISISLDRPRKPTADKATILIPNLTTKKSAWPRTVTTIVKMKAVLCTLLLGLLCLHADGRNLPYNCTLPKAPGPCKEAKLQYFYNSNKQKCEKFHYGGCEGNANRFNTIQMCHVTCGYDIGW